METRTKYYVYVPRAILEITVAIILSLLILLGLRDSTRYVPLMILIWYIGSSALVAASGVRLYLFFQYANKSALGRASVLVGALVAGALIRAVYAALQLSLLGYTQFSATVEECNGLAVLIGMIAGMVWYERPWVSARR